MNSVKEFFKSVLEAIVEARKARADQLVSSLRNGK